MTEVIEERKLPPWCMEVTCAGLGRPRSKPGCGSLLRVVESDLTRVRDYITHRGSQVAVVVCPLEHCGVETDTKESAMPAWVFDALRQGEQRGSAPSFGERD